MRYAISEITNPQSYCGEDRGFFFVQDDSHLKVLGELHYDGTDASINSIFFLFWPRSSVPPRYWALWEGGPLTEEACAITSSCLMYYG